MVRKTTRRGFTLVELLVVIAIIAVLLAVLMPGLQVAKGMGQRLQCSSRLKSIGSAYSMYATAHQDWLPLPEYYELRKNSWGNRPNRWILHYYVYRRMDYGWLHLGGLHGAGYIDDGRLFYCPATEEWRQEYESYSDPKPWGSLPQNIR